MAIRSDILIIGAGIAGVSVAARLAATHRVGVLDMEERPGSHATARSAATYEPNYGPAPIRALTRASRSHFEDHGLLSRRETLFLVPDGQEAQGARLAEESVGLIDISEARAREKMPLLKAGYARRGLLDPDTGDLDVDRLHQGFLRALKGQGGALMGSAPAQAIERKAGEWRVATPAGRFSAPVLVNAAGAWGDVVASLAGVEPIGLQPKRRSMAVVPAPAGHDVAAWPLISDVGETFYAKPQSGKLLVSPAEATPVEPHDAYADDLALAEGLARFEQAVDMKVTRIEHSWAGLRSFVTDGSPVCGYDPSAQGFFWLVGQGGYGIQSAPAMARAAAALIGGERIPDDIAREGFEAADLAPDRFRAPHLGNEPV